MLPPQPKRQVYASLIRLNKIIILDDQSNRAKSIESVARRIELFKEGQKQRRRKQFGRKFAGQFETRIGGR